MRKKISRLLSSALALSLALSGIGFSSGSMIPAVTVFAQENTAQEGSAEGSSTKEMTEPAAEDKAPAAENAQTTEETEQQADTETAEILSPDRSGESVTGAPAAADSAKDAENKDTADPDNTKQTEADQDRESETGDENDASAGTEQENPSAEGSGKDSSTETGKENASTKAGKDDSSKITSFTVENWRNYTGFKGAVKSVKLDGKDFTDAEFLPSPAKAGTGSDASSKNTGTGSDASSKNTGTGSDASSQNTGAGSNDSSTASSGKDKETAAPLTFKAGQEISVEIELNPGYVFDDTAGDGWSVWWNHRNEDGEFLTVSGSEKAHASEENPLLLKGTIALPPADKTKYAYMDPEDVDFDTLTLTFGARKVIDSLGLSVAAPVCGTKITMDKDTGEQTGAPAVSLPKNPKYEVAWKQYIVYDEEETLVFEPFTGTIKGGSTYYAFLSLNPASDLYGFSTAKEMSAILKKEYPDGRVCFSSPLMISLIVPVTAVHTDTEEVVAKETKATCTSAGVKTTETRCKGCGTVLDTKEEKTPVDKNAHDWDEWKVTKEPTATQTGIKTRVCKNDASHTETQEIPATGETEETVTYTFTKGGNAAWTKSTTSTADLSFTIKRSVEDDKTYSLFEGITVDGKAVDSSHYTAASGSLNLTLKNAYLKTLATGTHTLTVKFQDGSAATRITVKAASTAASNTTAKKTAASNSPKTGDENRPLLWAGLGACALAAILVIAAIKRKKK